MQVSDFKEVKFRKKKKGTGKAKAATSALDFLEELEVNTAAVV